MKKRIEDILQERILVLDGAMGTMIQQHHLTEKDYRGNQFSKFSAPDGERALFLKGNNELLSITKPKIIQDIHEEFLEAGADIIETNTFGANSIAQDDYYMPHLVHEMNLASVKIARKAVGNYSSPE